MEILKSFFYTPLLLLIFNALLIIAGTLHYNKLNKFKIFYFYSILAFIQSISSILIQTYNIFNLSQTRVIEISVNFFNLIEFLTFSYFSYLTFSRLTFKKAVKLISIIFCLLTVGVWVANFRINFFYPADNLTVISNFIIINYPFVYFYELLKDPPVTKLSSDPTFWIMTGIFILSGLLIPQFLIRIKVFQLFPSIYTYIYSITFIAYCLMYLCFIKAFLWQAKAHK